MKKTLKTCSALFFIILLTICGNIFTVSAEEFETEKVDVSDIVIADYNSTLEVGETLALSVTVLPSNADEQTVTYKSLNEAVATVSQTGEIKGISDGKAKILLSAGTVQKEIDLTIKVSAKGINVENDYIVLKPNETQQIIATVFPEKTTEKDLLYSCKNTSVATVTKTGLIKAVGCGSTSVIVKNADAIAAVTVIVNNNLQSSVNIAENDSKIIEMDLPETIYTNDFPMITKELLAQLYKSQKSICIIGDGYTIHINGADIKNINNTLNTDIQLKNKKDKLYFTLNKDKNLCGSIDISIDGAEKYKYLYLYNDTEKKYKLIENSDFKNLTISSSGKYVLTNSKISYSNIPWIPITIVCILLIVLVVVYICLKRKYWFW